MFNPSSAIARFFNRLAPAVLMVAAAWCARVPDYYVSAFVLLGSAALFLLMEYLDRPTPPTLLETVKQTIDEARNAGAQFLMNITGTNSPDAALRQFVDARKADDDAFAAAVKNQMSPPPAT